MINWKRISACAILPRQIHKDQLVYRVNTVVGLFLVPGESVLVHTGLMLDYQGYTCFLTSASFIDGVVVINKDGTLPTSRGEEVKIAIRNIGAECVTIENGSPIAQVVFVLKH